MAKLKYESPLVIVDALAADSTVASCADTSPGHTQNDCAVDYQGLAQIWNVTGAGSPCTMDETDMGNKKSNDGVCYHIPTESMQYFAS